MSNYYLMTKRLEISLFDEVSGKPKNQGLRLLHLFQTQLFAGNSMFFRYNSCNGCGLAEGCLPLDTLALEHCSPGALLALGSLNQTNRQNKNKQQGNKAEKDISKRSIKSKLL